MASVGTTPVKIADAGTTLVLQNAESTARIAFGHDSGTLAVAEGGTGLILEPGDSTDRFEALRDLYAVSDTLASDLRVEVL